MVASNVFEFLHMAYMNETNFFCLQLWFQAIQIQAIQLSIQGLGLHAK